jgi:preprotein translocase subunit SecD
MNKRIRTRSIVIVLITVASILLFSGFPPSIAGLKQRVRLGLDLQGGTQIVLQVNVDDALKATTDQTVEALRTQLEKANITVRQLTRTSNDTFEARGVDPARDADFRNMIEGSYSDFDIADSQRDVANNYTMKLKARNAEEYKVQAVDQALRTIATRIDTLGVAEPVIQKRGGPGEHEIVVQFPGIDDPEKLKQIIGKPAFLEFKLVQGESTFPTKDAALQQYGGVLPTNLEVLESQKGENAGAKVYYIVNKSASVTAAS